MTKKVHIYGFAYTPKSYAGTTGRFALDMDIDVADDTDVEDVVAGIESYLIDEGIKFYGKEDTAEDRGELTYAVSSTDEPAQPIDYDVLGKEIMDTAKRLLREKKGGVERNLTESRDEEREYKELSEFEEGEE